MQPWTSSLEKEEALAYTVGHVLGHDPVLQSLRVFESSVTRSVTSLPGIEKIGRFWNFFWKDKDGLRASVLTFEVTWGPLGRTRKATFEDIAMAEKQFGFDISCSKLREKYIAKLSGRAYRCSK
jgi:hypothetical protein